MQLSLKYDLPFTTVTIAYMGVTLEIPDVLVDTGSASTVLYWFSLGISHISVVSGLVPVLFASQDAHKGLDYG